jgi:hypothetical protein
MVLNLQMSPQTLRRSSNAAEPGKVDDVFRIISINQASCAAAQISSKQVSARVLLTHDQRSFGFA